MLSVVPWDGVRCCGADVELAVGSVTARRMTGRDLVSCPLGNAGMVTRGVAWCTAIQWCCVFLSRGVFSWNRRRRESRLGSGFRPVVEGV